MVDSRRAATLRAVALRVAALRAASRRSVQQSGWLRVAVAVAAQARGGAAAVR